MDEADVGSGLQQMGGVRMTEAVNANLLVDTGTLEGLLEHYLGASGGVGPAVLSFEEEFLRTVRPEIGAELLQDAGRQGNIAVLLAFGPADVGLHVGTVDVLHLQRYQFTDAQAHTVAEPQHGVVLQIRRMVEEPFHVLRADVLRQVMWFLGPGDLGEELFLVKHLFDVELDRIEPAVERGLGQVTVVGAVQHVAPQLFRGHGVHGNGTQGFEELDELVPVGAFGVGAVALQPQGVHEALQGRCILRGKMRLRFVPGCYGGQAQTRPMGVVVRNMPSLVAAGPAGSGQPFHPSDEFRIVREADPDHCLFPVYGRLEHHLRWPSMGVYGRLTRSDHVCKINQYRRGCGPA